MRKVFLIYILLQLFLIGAEEFNISAGDSFLRDIYDKSPIPGFSITILHRGDEIYSKGFGVEVYGEDKTFTSDSVIAAGQLTTMFNNMLILNLRDEGKLKLDDPITDYIPWFRLADGRESQITIKMLLTGTSGLPGTWSFVTPGDESEDADRRLGLSLSSSFLNREPGSSFEVNFEEHVLVGLIIEEITGESYADYVTREIIKGLNLTSTAIRIPDIEALNPVRGHHAGINRAIPVSSVIYDASYVAAMSLLHSTSRDIAKFTRVLLNNPIYEDIFKEYSTTIDLRDNSENRQGMNIGFYSDDGKEFASYGANILTSGGAVLMDREKELIIVLMANIGNQLAKHQYHTFAYIINSLYRSINNLKLNDKFGLEPDKTENSYELPENLIDRYVGTYIPVSGDRAMISKIEYWGDRLTSYVIRSGRVIFEYDLDYVTEELAITRNISYPQQINFRVSREGDVLGLTALGSYYLKSSGISGFTEELSPKQQLFFMHSKKHKVSWSVSKDMEVFNISGIKGYVGNRDSVQSFKTHVVPEDISYESFNGLFWEKYIIDRTLFMECNNRGYRVLLELDMGSKDFRVDLQDILLPILESFTLY